MIRSKQNNQSRNHRIHLQLVSLVATNTANTNNFSTTAPRISNQEKQEVLEELNIKKKIPNFPEPSELEKRLMKEGDMLEKNLLETFKKEAFGTKKTSSGG